MGIKNRNNDSLIGHLDDLRKTIFYCLGSVLCGTVLGLFVAKDIITLLKFPARGIIDHFILLKPTEAVAIYVKVALYAGCCIASPAILYFIWQFVKPAVGEDMRRGIVGWSLAALGLFAAGTYFAYAVLIPAGLGFLLRLSQEIAEPMFNLNGYISFMLSLLILSGIVFEMPVIAAMLTRVGLITPRLMRRRRKEAFFGLMVIAAVVTPTTDIFNMLLFVAPMIVLYEASILISSLVSRSVPLKPGEEAYYNEA